MIFKIEKNRVFKNLPYGSYWFKNGKSHREKGPAIIFFSGKRYWRQNGLCHREDGPAVIEPDGKKSLVSIRAIP